MFYSDKVLKALRIAFAAHAGQFDKAGYPYFLHPYHLAEQMSDEDSVIVALLHDVIEDTSVTVEDLRKEGFTVFSTVTTRLRRKLLEALGNECLGEYGKLMLTK